MNLINSELFLEPLRAIDPLYKIIRNFVILFERIFGMGANAFMKNLISTIMGNEYLLISVSLLVIGFVIGIIKRLIQS